MIPDTLIEKIDLIYNNPNKIEKREGKWTTQNVKKYKQKRSVNTNKQNTGKYIIKKKLYLKHCNIHTRGCLRTYERKKCRSEAIVLKKKDIFVCKLHLNRKTPDLVFGSSRYLKISIKQNHDILREREKKTMMIIIKY